MWKRFWLVLAAVLAAAAPAAAQVSPLDKLQHSQIPAFEREGLPPDVVAVLGSHRGWPKAPGFVNSLHVTSQGRMISAMGAGIQLWDQDGVHVVESVSGNPRDDAQVAAVSPDGKRLAVVQKWRSKEVDGQPTPCTLELWEVQLDKVKRMATLVDGGLASIGSDLSAAFLDNGDRLVILWAQGGGKIATDLRIWDLTATPPKEEPSLELTALPLPAKTTPRAARLTHGGRTVAVVVAQGEGDRVLKSQLVTVDLATRQTLKAVVLPVENPPAVIRVSDDGRWLASIEEYRTLRVFDLATSPAKLIFAGPTAAYVYRPPLALDAGGKWLAYVGNETEAGRTKPGVDGTRYSLRLIDLTAGVPKEQVLATDLEWPPDVLTLAQDGKTLLAGLEPGRVASWDLQSGQAVPRHPPLGHSNAVWTVAFTPDGKSLLTAGRDRQLCLWNLADGKPALAHAAKDRSMVYSLTPLPGGSLWVSSGFDPGGLSLWKLADGKLTLARQFLAQQSPVWDAAISPDGRWLYSATGDEALFEYPEGAKEKKGPTEGLNIWQLSGTKAFFRKNLGQHKGAVLSLALSPDGKVLVSGGGRTTYLGHEPNSFAEVFVWDVSGAEPKKISSLDGHTKIIYRVRFSPDGKMVATAGRDRVVGLWSHEDSEFKLRRVLEGHNDSVLDVAFAPDGKTVVTCDAGGKLVLWNARIGKALQSWQLRGRICALAFAPDGRHFATANAWGTAYIFRVAASKPSPSAPG